MALTIPVAHDFVCPWCWAALLQVRRLQAEFDVEFDWIGYELFPVGMDYPRPGPAPEVPANKPPVPNRFEFLQYADGFTMPSATRPRQMRTTNAHLAVEFAKRAGRQAEVIEAIYTAYWERGLEINDLHVLRTVLEPVVEDIDALIQSVESREFFDQIVPYDDPAYATGVYNVPTFFIGDQRLAEQPYVVLHRAVQAVLGVAAD
ncbi:MAG: DsbA family oxidoreductase [Fimbriimonas sp.]